MSDQSAIENLSQVQRAVILAVLAMASGLAILSLTIANAVLPQMQGDLSAGLEEISWVVTAPVAATAIAMSASGWFGMRLGQPRALLLCMFGFTAMSFMLGFATSLEEVIFLRAWQGLFAGPIPPMSIAMVLNIYPTRQQGMAMMGMAAGYVLAPTMGPVVGAYLTELYSWRLAFASLAPFGVMLFLLILATTPVVARRTDLRFDWFGFLSLACALAAAQWTLDRGNREDWFDSSEILLTTVIAGFALYLFLVHSMTTRQPFVDLRIFRDRNYVIALTFWAVAGILEFAPLILMPTMLGRLQEVPVETIGLLLAPRGIGFIFSGILTGSLIKITSSRALLAIGMAIHIPALWYLSTFDLTVGLREFFIAGILLGAAEYVLFAAATAIGFSTLAIELRGYGSAIFQCGRFFLTSVGISLSITLLSRSTQANRANQGQAVSPYNETLPLINKAEFWDVTNLAGLARLEGEISRQSVMLGYLNDFSILAWLAVAMMPLILFLDRPRAP